MHPLSNQHVLILGLGASGLAMARWCARNEANVTVVDTRQSPPQLEALMRDVPQATFLHAPFDASLVEGSSVRAVFKSPGLTPIEVAPVFIAAHAMGVWTTGELDLFSQALADLKESRGYDPKVLAVTGTNGKTTVTSLTGQLITRAGKTVAVAGNIGPTLLDTLSHALDDDRLPDVWVIELSSFQLDQVTRFEPSAATVLNITQDHLDWHGSMAEYTGAKGHIFGESALMVLNRDDAGVMALLPAPVKGRALRQWIGFGSDMPQRPGDFGIEQVNGMVWLVRALEADETLKKRKGVEEEVHIQRLMPADALRIRGRHNALNALAALALASAAGCALGPLLYGLREYRGEPHRVQPVGIINDVEFFDDSKGTNVGATVAALNGLGADRKVVVILGGEGKGQDFSPLQVPVERFARAVVLMGRDSALIRTALAGCGVPVKEVTSMSDAVTRAFESAQPGDAVLMSPACASFDMFDNYEHRARVFCESVNALADSRGVVLEGVA